MFEYRTHKITSQDNLPELWRTEGKIYRQKREGLHISRKELSKEAQTINTITRKM